MWVFKGFSTQNALHNLRKVEKSLKDLRKTFDILNLLIAKLSVYVFTNESLRLTECYLAKCFSKWTELYKLYLKD